jgi:hypothetical protein
VDTTTTLNYFNRYKKTMPFCMPQDDCAKATAGEAIINILHGKRNFAQPIYSLVTVSDNNIPQQAHQDNVTGCNSNARINRNPYS